MNRRTAAIAILLLGLIALTVVIGRRQLSASSTKYAWGWFYYMPYDNDLGHTFEPAIKQIQSGIGPNTVAVIYADLPGRDGIRRVEITSRGTRQTQLATDNSASVQNLATYIESFLQSYDCQSRALVLMGHGGPTSQMCFDQSPEEWMSAEELGLRLRKNKPFDLLFLQQCGRASLQNLFHYRDTAEFILAAPNNVSAWDPFLTPVHRWIDANPAADGQAAGRAICMHNTNFELYLLIRGRLLTDIAQWCPSIAKLELPNQVMVEPVYEFESTSAYDLGEVNTEALDDVIPERQTAAFLKWVEQELIAERFPGDRPYSGRIGLTICVVNPDAK